MEAQRRAVLIAGPTASGKSALALRIAGRLGGTVVNADSMQVYDGLRLLTARPAEAEERAAPHRLYGHVDPTLPHSAGLWLREAAAVLGETWASGGVPVVVGGTGLYLNALLGRLDAMPAVPEAVRERWRARLAADGAPRLHAVLAVEDPEGAARIRPADGQRIVRALEVLEATGAPIGRLRRGGGASPLAGARVDRVLILPPRTVSRERIGRRFDAMLEAGALAEAEAFLGRPGAADGPAAHAIGLRELGAVLAGETGLPEAAERAKARTRRYAKRQETFFRTQFDAGWRRCGGVDAAWDDFTGF